MTTKIEWTDETWNPVTGCTKVSPGCAHCYIERTPPMRMAGRRFVNGRIPVQLHPDRLDQPLRWRKPRCVFVCSMGDLFHEDVPDEFIYSMFGVMAKARQHTFQVLTKRPARMHEWISQRTAENGRSARVWSCFEGKAYRPSWPLSNVWLGVSAENQKAADERYPLLRDTPAVVRFYSLEPLLGPIWNLPLEGISWVIVGGESGGPPERALVERCNVRFHHGAEICMSPTCPHCFTPIHNPRERDEHHGNLG